MSDEKNELFNRIAESLKNKETVLQDVVINSRWRDELDRSRFFGVNPVSEGDTTLLGMNVHYSDFVEEGTAYLVNKQFNSIRFTPPPVDMEFMEGMKRIESFMADYFYRGMGIPASLIQDDKPYRWQHKQSETILQWGDRLFAKGLLDNPAIRWEYQKAVLGAPFNKLKALWIEYRA